MVLERENDMWHMGVKMESLLRDQFKKGLPGIKNTGPTIKGRLRQHLLLVGGGRVRNGRVGQPADLHPFLLQQLPHYDADVRG